MAKRRIRVRKKKQNRLGMILVLMVVVILMVVVAVNNHNLNAKLASYREKEKMLTEQIEEEKKLAMRRSEQGIFRSEEASETSQAEVETETKKEPNWNFSTENNFHNYDCTISTDLA